MSAQISDLITQATTNSRPSPTTVTVIRVAAGATLQCNVLTGWPTSTAVHFITYKIDTSGNKIAGSQIDMKGIVSGTQLTQIVIKAGSDVGNAVGDIVEASPTAAWANDVVAWGTGHANQDGSLITSAVQTALGLSNLNGYTPVGFTPNTITDNGNRSYSLVFNGQDLTSFLSNGIRLRTTRTVTAPTQCTSLNGSTQFYSKTSPAGMTFTNNFVVSAWVKLSAYPGAAAYIASRYNGTSGWECYIDSSGRVVLSGKNAASANFSQVQSYQSVPLNKWVHVAAQLDMATFTATPTTSYVMIDGVDVPATVSRGGTNPTALVQAGNLEIGSGNGGGGLMNGKLAQVAIYSAKVTEATIVASRNQTLVGTETSLISAYSFNNTINDLNANANNLTANGSAVATNTDTPFTQTLNLTGYTTGTTNFGIITSSSFSTNTTVVVQVPEGDTLPTSGGISAVVYSSNKAPFAFPTQRGKWVLRTLARSGGSQASPVQNTWYNVGSYSLNIPIGEWKVGYSAMANTSKTATSFIDVYTTLSTANNSEADAEFTTFSYFAGASGNLEIYENVSKTKDLSLSSATIYYLNARSDHPGADKVGFAGSIDGVTFIEAELAYL